jgi:hypothetical protein
MGWGAFLYLETSEYSAVADSSVVECKVGFTYAGDVDGEGGLYFDENAMVELPRDNFTACHANNYGSAFYVATENSYWNASELTVLGLLGYSGIYSMSSNRALVSLSNFYNNSKLDSEWGVLCSYSSGMIVRSCLFMGNSAEARIDSLILPFQFSNCVFSGEFPKPELGVIDGNCVAISVTASWPIRHVDTFWCMGETPAATQSTVFEASLAMYRSSLRESAVPRVSMNNGFQRTQVAGQTSSFDATGAAIWTAGLGETEMARSGTRGQSNGFAVSIPFHGSLVPFSVSEIGGAPSTIAKSLFALATQVLRKTAPFPPAAQGAVTIPARRSEGFRSSVGSDTERIPDSEDGTRVPGTESVVFQSTDIVTWQRTQLGLLEDSLAHLRVTSGVIGAAAGGLLVLTALSGAVILWSCKRCREGYEDNEIGELGTRETNEFVDEDVCMTQEAPSDDETRDRCLSVRGFPPMDNSDGVDFFALDES